MAAKRRHTIKNHFILLTLSLIIFLSIGLSTLFYYLYTYSLNKTMLQNSEANIRYMSDSINYQIGNITKFSQWCQNNSDIADFLLSKRTDANYNHVTALATKEFNKEFAENSSKAYMQRVVIASFSNDGYLQIVPNEFSKDCNMPAMIQNLPYFVDCIGNDTVDTYPFHIENSVFPCVNRQMIPLIQMIESPYGTQPIGFIYTEISIELFKESVNSYTENNLSNLYLTVSKETYQVLASRHLELATRLSDYKELQSNDLISANTLYGSLSNGHEKIKLVSYPLSLPGCYISQELTPSIFQEWHSQYIFVIIGIFFLMLVIGILLLSSFNQIFTTPVQKIHHRIDELSIGNFEPDLCIEWNNELGDIGRYLNKLGNDINNLIQKRIQSECEKKDYEYKMLQSQINPHFMYNTLNSIKWMAIAQSSDGIADMTTALSRLLKNISKGNNGIVSIDYEISLLNDYFTIQNYRYGGAITLIYEIEDESLRKNQILRFTLQPVVENAIFHGIEPKGESGQITVRIVSQDSYTVRISITDNGVGMAPELIEETLNNEMIASNSFFKNMGMGSVNKMLRYTFGETYGMRIESELGRHTTVHILLPKKEYQEVPKNEAINCR